MKLYFNQSSPDFCYPIDYWYQQMKDEGLTKMSLIEAKLDPNKDLLFCKHYQSCGLKSEGGCGKFCEGYKPKNGKWGMCRHQGKCYEPTEKMITIRL